MYIHIHTYIYIMLYTVNTVASRLSVNLTRCVEETRAGPCRVSSRHARSAHTGTVRRGQHAREHICCWIAADCLGDILRSQLAA